MPHTHESELQTSKRSILVVEDNALNREMLYEMLRPEFEVFLAEDGLDGLEQLERHYENLSLILLDVYMPRCDGFEFLRRKRADQRFEPIPVVVATASDLPKDEIECLRLGANDFIVKPYLAEVMTNRINNIIHLRESASIVNQLTWDSLTGLYSSDFFFRRVARELESPQQGPWDMVCADVTNFKALTDRYGKKNCDAMLAELAGRLRQTLPSCIAGGRIDNTTCAFLIEHQDSHEWCAGLDDIAAGLISPSISVKLGVVEDIDPTLAPPVTCNQAITALEQVKDSFGVALGFYDKELHDKQAREQVILETMEVALAERQFVVYFQPKVDARTQAPAGAEALVRWIHPELGFVRPDHFIPLFERNGFITRLDLYVLEQACKQIVRCRELGLPVIPISANLSRLDFDLPDLVERITQIVDRHNVDRALLHIELTETAYSDDPARVTEALAELHRRGFVIELDDFGSGYSSLASLNVLPLDVMKLDMSIIRQAARLDDYRIVHATIQMAQFLGLKTVAEGVETERECDTLRSLGCDMIQGYYFAKPLAPEEFEDYIS